MTLFCHIVFTTAVVLFATPQNMPPLERQEQQRHPSDYSKRINHPTSYDDNPPFKGPLVLNEVATPDYYRRRIRGYYLSDELLKETISADMSKSSIQLSTSSSTATIIKSIINHLARKDAPVDVKEVVESTEFYLRTGKRLFGAARRVLKNNMNQQDNDIITIHDLCSGHGLTGMLFAACNPYRGTSNTNVPVVLVDRTKPQSHDILREIVSEVCPWVTNDSVHFISSTLQDYISKPEEIKNNAKIVISTHACGSLTDDVLNFSVNRMATAVAVMPCCYTGTDSGTPYGLRRMLGVSLSADVRRSFYLQDNGFHVDLATIPKAITPMNRIIVAEQRK